MASASRSRVHEGYPRGAIKRLKLTDFMSFVGTTCLEPGPRINLITGPNGSGKSSIVTAVCVALGGHMKNLGRQKRPDELIRRGCSAFEVEATLSGGEGQRDVVVRRRTELVARAGAARKKKRGRGGADGEEDDGEEDDGPRGDEEGGQDGGMTCRDTWFIDGAQTNAKAVQQVMAELNIHFDNLCQFLPQERVVEFAHMGPQELLKKTEEAIGKGELLMQHEQLIGLRREQRQQQEALSQLQTRLAKLQEEQEGNRPEYERLQRRERYRREVELLERKLLWLDVRQRDSAVQAARRGHQQVKADLQVAREHLAAARQPFEERRELAEAAAARARDIKQAAGRKDAAARNALRDAEALKEQLVASTEELQNVRSKSAVWSRNLAAAQARLQAVKSLRATLATDISAEQQQRLVEIAAQLPELEGRAAAVNAQLEQKQEEISRNDEATLELQAAAQHEYDRRDQLIAKLDSRMPGSRDVVNWLEKTKREGGFQRRVVGPLLLEMSAVVDPDWAKYLEQAIGEKSLCAVLTECDADHEKVSNWLYGMRQQANGRAFNHRVVFVRGSGRPVNHPLGDASHYREYGITHTLDELFTAPQIVKLALTDFHGINATYVGAERCATPAMMEKIMTETPIRAIYTPKTSTFIKVSQYDANHRIQRIDRVRDAYLLSDAAAADGREEAAAARQQQLQALQQERQQLDAQRAKLEQKLTRLSGEVTQLRDEQANINRQRKALERSRLECQTKEHEALAQIQRLMHTGDPINTATALKARIADTAGAIGDKAGRALALFRDQHVLLRQLAVVEAEEALAKAQAEALHNAVGRAQHAVDAVTTALQAAKAQVDDASAHLAEAKAQLQEALGQAEPDTETMAAWRQHPDGQDELKDVLEDKRARMDEEQAAMRGSDQQVLSQWSRREKEMSESTAAIAQQQSRLDTLTEDLSDQRDAWLPLLREKVELVNGTFQRLFATIGCAGEVGLKEVSDDFEEFAAEIRVQFRPEEAMQVLNPNRQSGGERSVSTMMYLIALQGVTSTPFRIVDEINQGMDSRNERKVFEQLVDNSSRPDTPQCFLLTPKLIGNLQYNPHVLAHNINHLPRAHLELQATLPESGAGLGRQQAAGGRTTGGAASTVRDGIGHLTGREMKDFLFFGVQGLQEGPAT